MASLRLAHPRSRLMLANEGNALLAPFFPLRDKNFIGDALAAGPDARRGKTDMLRRRRIGWGCREACGARREFRASADWRDGKEAHEATCSLAFRWEGARRWEPVL